MSKFKIGVPLAAALVASLTFVGASGAARFGDYL